MAFLRKYNTLTVTGTTAIRIPIIKRGVVDFAVSADWTPAAGDVKIAIDGAAAANVTNLPTAVAMGNGAYWEFILTAAELTCKSCVVTVADSATKAVEDQAFIVETFGHASAMYQADLSAANLPANLVQIAGDAQSATDLKDFADAGYDPSTNKVQGVVLVDTLTTYTGNTVQTGDSFARIGATGSGLTSLAPASTALSTAQWTNTLATNLGTTNTTVATNLDATVSSRLASASYTTPPTVAAVADAVWDEARAGHTTAGTFGFYLDAAITGISAGSGATAQQVWEYATRTLTGAVELDPAVGTQITAIETFATRMTTGLVQDGAVYQFTANMLELGPSGGGGSSVNVLPATGIVSDRSAGTTLLPVVGETISQSITVYQSDGTTAVSLSGKTLKVIFETMSGVDVAVVAAADITISGTSSNIVTFAYPSAVTASERTLRFAIRDAAAPLTMYLQGVCSVVAAPKVDA